MSNVEPPGGDELAGQSPEQSGAPPEPKADTPSFGRTLAQARESLGISSAEMAARLRLHPRQISALEEERLEALPELPFVRGFVRNYAKEVRLDPAPLLADLADKRPMPPPAEATPPPGGISAAEVRSAGMDRTSRAAVIGGSVLVLIVLGLIGWVASTRVETPVASPPAQPPAAAPAAGASVDVPAEPAAKGEGAEPAEAKSGDSRGPADSAAGGAPAAAEPAPEASPAPRPPAAVAGAGLRLVVGDRPSWVEISQGDGRVLLTGLLEAGSERRLGNPQPPLQLVIGNASSVTLEFRGKPVDLQRHIRGNDLARLTLE